MNGIPFVDWNRNGRIDPNDIALSLAITAGEVESEDDDDDIHGSCK